MISWKDHAEVVLTRNPPFLDVDDRYSTMEGVFNVACKTPEMQGGQYPIDQIISTAFFNNKWLKVVIATSTEGAWEKQTMDSQGNVVSYTIDTKTLATILSHVIAFHSTSFSRGAETDATRACDRLLSVFQKISDLKERKRMCKTGQPCNTVFNQLSMVPMMISNMHRSTADGMTPDQIVHETLMLQELSEKHPNVSLLFEDTKVKVEKCKGILRDYMLSDADLKAKYDIPKETSISEFLDGSPFKVKYLEKKVKSLKVTESGAILDNAKKLPLAPTMENLLKAVVFVENPRIALTSIEIGRLQKAAEAIFLENTTPPPGKDHDMLVHLTDQIHTHVLRVAEEYTTKGKITIAGGDLVSVRPMGLFVLHSLLMHADQSAVTAAETGTVQLSTLWKGHARANDIILWLTAVQKEAKATLLKGGFYLTIQNMTNPVIKQWKELLNDSRHIFNEVLDKLFYDIPYIMWDVLFIIAQAWRLPIALESREMFEDALDIKRDTATLTAEAPLSDENSTDSEEEDSGSKRSRGSRSPSADPLIPSSPKRNKVVSSVQKKAGVDLGKVVLSVQEQAVVDLGKVVTRTRWGAVGINDRIRDEVKTLLGHVKDETWGKIPPSANETVIMAAVYDDLPFDKFITDKVRAGTSSQLDAMAYHTVWRVANGNPTDPMDKLKESLERRFGKPA